MDDIQEEVLLRMRVKMNTDQDRMSFTSQEVSSTDIVY